ncbi:hypothetical protein [Pleionea sediminis]|uniref:hypothetical protein n=1 Tax=Pleionea sediminis TaxID=2569479 RepID=UPI001185A905|nr:hypothetical protein [Pleionea sediminis]
MDYTLTKNDKDYIWQVVHHAAESNGGYHHLFSTPLEFSENSDRVQFNWPMWMRAIKAYIQSRYGEEAAKMLLLDILAEVYDPQKYQAYLEREQTKNVIDSNSNFQFKHKA